MTDIGPLYVMDTCSVLLQRPGEFYPREIFETVWQNIDELIRSHVICFPQEIIDEIRNADLKDWLLNIKPLIFPSDARVQAEVVHIINNVMPELVDFKTGKSSGDPFLIATAKIHNLWVISEEKKHARKIPICCDKMGLTCINLLELCRQRSWKF